MEHGTSESGNINHWPKTWRPRDGLGWKLEGESWHAHTFSEMLGEQKATAKSQHKRHVQAGRHAS